jgi:hypothetical protein
MKRYLPIAGLLVGVAAGIFLQSRGLPGRVWDSLVGPPAGPTVAADPAERTEVPVDRLRGKRVLVALAFGQSNSANHGETPHAAGPGVLNFYLGKLYAARDPLLGATGAGGSVWTRFGDRVVAGGRYDAVVIAPIGTGSSEVARWAPGGDLHPRLIYTLRDLKAAGLPPTHLLWHQGESDRWTPGEAYRAHFLALVAAVRREGVAAPVYVSVATRSPAGVVPAVQAAQRGLVDPAAGIRAGPDTDALGDEFRNRRDPDHFNDAGLRRAAELWAEAVAPKPD